MSVAGATIDGRTLCGDLPLGEVPEACTKVRRPLLITFRHSRSCLGVDRSVGGKCSELRRWE